jgi:hypothetical protein
MVALRNMNQKLETKISEIMKKWEKVKIVEETSSQILKKYKELYEIIAHLNMEKNQLFRENDELKQNFYLKKKLVSEELESNSMNQNNNSNQESSKRNRNARSSNMTSSKSVRSSKNTYY